MMTRRMGVAATLVMACGAALAEPPPSECPVHAATYEGQNSAQNTNSTEQPNFSSKQVQSSLARLAGEWEGQVQVRKADGTVSSSIVTASNRLENNGAVLASRFEGFAFGRAFDGGVVWAVNPSEPKLESAWFDSFTNVTARATTSPCKNVDTFGGTGRATRSSEDRVLEQHVQIASNDQYVIEFFGRDDEGKRVSLLRLELQRLPKGQRAAAADRFDDGAVLNNLRVSVKSTAQATGTENR